MRSGAIRSPDFTVFTPDLAVFVPYFAVFVAYFAEAAPLEGERGA